MVIVTTQVEGGSIESEVMNGAVITDAVPLEIVPQDDQKLVEDGVLNGGAEVNEEKEVAAEGEEDNVVDDGEHEDEGKAAAEGGGDDASESYEDEDVSDEEEKVAAEGGGGGEDGVFDEDEDEDEDEDVEEEDFVLNNEEVDDDVAEDVGEEEEEGYAFMDEDTDEVENNSGWLEADDAGEDKEGGSDGKESGKKEDEEKGGGNSEPRVRKLKRIVKVVAKNVVENSSDEVIVVEKGKTEKDGEKAPVEEEKGKGNEKEEIGEKGKGVRKRLRLRKGDKKKGVSGSAEKVASEPTVKSDSKRKEKVAPKRVESMGMVFMCSSKTKQDCYKYKVLGLPAGKRDVVEKIYRGMRLFLYDVDLKLMYGIYKAAAPGGYNLEPKAFNSKFPSQVRFTVLEDCIPLAEENFRKVLKENYFSKNKFDCQLSHEQVKNMCKLFSASSKGPNSRRLDRRPKAKAPGPTMRRDRPGPPRGGVDQGRKRDRPRAPAVDDGRQRKRTRRVDEGRPRDRARVPEGRPRNGYSSRNVALEDNYRQRDYLHLHQGEVVAPLAVGVPRLAVLPPPIDAPRYAYDRPTVFVEHQAPYREPLLVSRDAYKPLPDYRDAYRQLPLTDYRDAHRQVPVIDRYDAYRRDRAPEHRDLQAVNLEPRRYDPYSYSRDRESYRDPVYSEHRLPVEQPDRYRSYRTEYRSGGSPVPDYRPSRALHHRY